MKADLRESGSGRRGAVNSRVPLVYSCSGASSAAQMANHLAVRLDRMGVAEMSCAAGLGGDVGPLVKVAKSGRPIVAIDGCPLHCVASILRRHGLEADRHYDLSDGGVKKRKHEDFSLPEAERVLRQIVGDPTFPPGGGPMGDAMSGCAECASPPCFMPAIED